MPGVLLLAGVAAPQRLAAAMIVTRHRAALWASYLAGLALLAWIGEVGLAWLWQRTGRPAPDGQDFRP